MGTTVLGGVQAATGERHPVPSKLSILVRALVRDKLALLSAAFLLVVVLAALGADYISPHPPNAQSIPMRNRPPGTASLTGRPPNLLGTDALGRDELTRLIYGARISLTVGFLSVLVSGALGILLGLVAGYYGGWVDDLIMRLVDLQMGFPSLLLALFVLYVLGSGFWNVVLVLVVTRWMIYARITRGMMLSLREVPFVEAARAIGCGDLHIMFRHMLPNVLFPVLVVGTLEVAHMILVEASLSFLGLGIQPPDCSWGLMLAQGRDYITAAWWLVTFPGLAIMLTTLSFNLLATWMRAVTDPVQGWRWRSDTSSPKRQ